MERDAIFVCEAQRIKYGLEIETSSDQAMPRRFLTYDACEYEKEAGEITVTLAGGGMPFDPLAREDPDLTLPAEEREIGGLGILMVKKNMDEVSYAFRDEQNILTMRKKIGV